MASDRIDEPEKVLWEEYLRKCESEGKKPTPADFAKWARSMLGM